ncbi:Fungal cellulose binding domain [Phytophthora infestans]|uniref:Fungal cellulose binding domain n=1 Tax=Phytophthora infestans TaxID=4787 RepID=A0A8S9UT98_PHYIN|nr:Fungal cellulose binding domain [Phytophthora infestans]KAF4147147.1 Fungal cellulose binding domain [Phytophthora infestans]
MLLKATASQYHVGHVGYGAGHFPICHDAATRRSVRHGGRNCRHSRLSCRSSWDQSGFWSFDSDSVPATPDPLTPAPVAVAQPIANGVKMFAQCGGIFYSGTTECYDPDAYCKPLSIYSSICSPKPAPEV